jgi:hypothetical protein
MAYDPETLGDAQEFTNAVWGFISPDHARRIGVPEEEIQRQLCTSQEDDASSEATSPSTEE